MKEKLLKIAIVGHTNTGKTSLVRTLAHDRRFGEVQDRGGTTRQVAATTLAAGSRSFIELYDSPGLENAPDLLDWLDAAATQRHDGPERIRRLLDDAAARAHFDHEARVLTLLLEVDVALYVIDAREPVLEKYQDELSVLALCARPIVAVLNFVGHPASREQEWREALARVTLHTVLAFDAVVRDPATEIRLFEKLGSQLDRFAPLLAEWVQIRRDEETHRRQAALLAIAGLLTDVASYRQTAPPDQQPALSRQMQAAVRQREQACVDTLLDLYRFGHEDYADSELPLADGRWAADPFDPQTLAEHGIRASRYIGTGAGIGAAVDIGTGGLSLGAGTLAGTAIGAGASVLSSFGRNLLGKFQGTVELAVDEATLRLLAWRQLCLLKALIRRGHASQSPLRAVAQSRWQHARLPRPLRRARLHPGWSALGDQPGTGQGRELAIKSLAATLANDLSTISGGSDFIRE